MIVIAVVSMLVIIAVSSATRAVQLTTRRQRSARQFMSDMQFYAARSVDRSQPTPTR